MIRLVSWPASTRVVGMGLAALLALPQTVRAIAPPPTGTLGCTLTGRATITPGLPETPPGNATTTVKTQITLTGTLSGCDHSGQVGGALPIDGGTVKAKGTLLVLPGEPLPSCTGLATLPSTRIALKTSLKFTDSAAPGRARPIPVSKSTALLTLRFPSVVPPVSFTVSGLVARGAFVGEPLTITGVLDLDTLGLGAACTASGGLTQVSFTGALGPATTSVSDDCASICSSRVPCSTACRAQGPPTTCGAAGYAGSCGYYLDNVTCSDNGNAPQYTTATTWGKVPAVRRAAIITWMDNAAKNWCGTTVSLTQPVTDASGRGFTKWYGTPADPHACGVVYWNNATNCATFLSSGNGYVPNTSGNILAKYVALGAEASALGMPIANPTVPVLVGSQYTSYQQFENGFITYRSGDTDSHYIGGGTDRGLKAAATLYAAANGITSNVHPPLQYPLATDVTDVPCFSSSAGQGCGGYQWQTRPYLGYPEAYVSEVNSDVAFLVMGAIGVKYFTLGSTPETSWPGFPIGNETCGDPGCNFTSQSFHGGDIFFSGGNTFFVDTDFREAYYSEGGPTGPLGLPIEDSPSPGDTTIARSQQFQFGTIRIGIGGRPWTIAPPPTNPNGPTSFFLHAGVPNSDGTFAPNEVLSATSVGMGWFNNDASPGSSTTIYRSVTDIFGNSTPSTPIMTFGLLPLGSQDFIDTNATPNAKNCYLVGETNSAGLTAYSTWQCAYTRDGLNHRPARVQLSITTGNMPTSLLSFLLDDNVFVSLQGGAAIPSGNISWVDTTAQDFLSPNSTYTYDLNTFGTIHDLSDITQIEVGVDGPFPLCIANLELIIDDCGNGTGCGAYRVAYYKDYVADTGTCALAIDSFEGGQAVTVSFNDLRRSPDWQCQVSQSQPGCDPLETGQGWGPTHFQGFYNGNATKGFLMGLMSNPLHDHNPRARFNDGHPIELSVPSAPPSPGGATDERLGVKVHIQANPCDFWAQADVVLTTHCDASGQVVRTDVTLEPGNPAGDVEDLNWCTVGKAILDVWTLGLDHDWLEGEISDYFANKIAHAMSAKELGAPPPGTHFGFTPQPGGGAGCTGLCGGFGLRLDSVCDFHDACLPNGSACTVSADCCAGSACNNGVCAVTNCTDCGGTCVNVMTDNNNCGSCGNVCTTLPVCIGGVCTIP